jgi:hypothetical protein
LTKILPHFPKVQHLSSALEKRVEKVVEEEKDKRQDLYILAIGYAGMLKSHRPNLVIEHDFHKKSNTTEATQLRREDKDSSSNETTPINGGRDEKVKSDKPKVSSDKPTEKSIKNTIEKTLEKSSKQTLDKSKVIEKIERQKTATLDKADKPKGTLGEKTERIKTPPDNKPSSDKVVKVTDKTKSVKEETSEKKEPAKPHPSQAPPIKHDSSDNKKGVVMEKVTGSGRVTPADSSPRGMSPGKPAGQRRTHLQSADVQPVIDLTEKEVKRRKTDDSSITTPHATATKPVTTIPATTTTIATTSTATTSTNTTTSTATTTTSTSTTNTSSSTTISTAATSGSSNCSSVGMFRDFRLLWFIVKIFRIAIKGDYGWSQWRCSHTLSSFSQLTVWWLLFGWSSGCGYMIR